MQETSHTVYIVSGGKGLAGDQMVQSLLIQFPKNKVQTVLFPDIHTIDQIHTIVDKAASAQAIITHTMVNNTLRNELNIYAEQNQVRTIDFFGELSTIFENEWQLKPIGKPGLYRKVNIEYFNRIEAIEYTLATDDGMNTDRLHHADIILTGVSRSGKTPLSIYLAMYGWKVANIPLVKDIPPPKTLFEVDPNRVFALNINVIPLLEQRQKRLKALGHTNMSYADPTFTKQELHQAHEIFRRGRFTVINVTNKSIETSANEISTFMSERFEYSSRKYHTQKDL